MQNEGLQGINTLSSLVFSLVLHRYYNSMNTFVASNILYLFLQFMLHILYVLLLISVYISKQSGPA